MVKEHKKRKMLTTEEEEDINTNNGCHKRSNVEIVCQIKEVENKLICTEVGWQDMNWKDNDEGAVCTDTNKGNGNDTNANIVYYAGRNMEKRKENKTEEDSSSEPSAAAAAPADNNNN